MQRKQKNLGAKGTNRYSNNESSTYLHQLKQQMEDLDADLSNSDQKTQSDDDLTQAQIQKLRQKYNKEKKRFLKVAEPNSLSDVEDQIEIIEERLKEIDPKEFYCEQLEQRKSLAEKLKPKKRRSKEEKQSNKLLILEILKKLKRERRKYENLQEIQDQEDIEETLEDLRETIDTIPDDEEEFEDSILYFRNLEKKYEAQLQELSKNKLSEEEIRSKTKSNLEIEKEHKKNIRNMKKYREPKNQEEIKERIEEIEEYLEELPEGHQEFEEIKAYYLTESERWKGKILKPQKLTKTYSPEEIKSKLWIKLEMLKEQKAYKKSYLKFREPQRKEEFKERLEELKAQMDELPSGYEEFNEPRQFYEREMDKLEKELQKLERTGSKKKPIKKLPSSESEDDEKKQIEKPQKKKNKKKIAIDSEEEKEVEVKPKPKKAESKKKKKINDTDEEEGQEEPPKKKASTKKKVIKNSEESEGEQVAKRKTVKKKFLPSDSDSEEKEERKSKVKYQGSKGSRGSGIKKENQKKNQKKYNDDSPSSESDDTKRKSKKDQYKELTDDEVPKQKSKKLPIESSDDNRPVKKKKGKKIANSSDEEEEKNKPIKKQLRTGKKPKMQFDSEEDDAEEPKKKQKKHQEAKVPPPANTKNIRLQCGHEFKKEELKRYFEQRTDGLIHTMQFDEVGEKSFKCLKCFHLITDKERVQIIGEKLDRDLASKASERMAGMFDKDGNLKKSENKMPVCLLCDSPGELEGNHDEHVFCKQCWKGVISQYKEELGCLMPNCPYQKRELNSTKVKDWIKAGGLDQQNQDWQELQIQQKFKSNLPVKGKQELTEVGGGAKCETCGATFEKWKFSSCEEDCDIKLCKKCAADLLRQENNNECFVCFEIISPAEYNRFIEAN